MTSKTDPQTIDPAALVSRLRETAAFLAGQQVHHFARAVSDAADALTPQTCICQDDGDGMTMYDAACPNDLHAKRALTLQTPDREAPVGTARGNNSPLETIAALDAQVRHLERVLSQTAADHDATIAKLDTLTVAHQQMREALNPIIEAMRAERPRYKSHDLGFVDSVSAQRVDEWADELEALARPLPEKP